MKVDKNQILKLLFFTLIFLIFFLPHSDTDFGWHYRCGHELIHLQKPCINNTFSYFLSDYKWAYPAFIYDSILSITFDAGGFLVLSILGSIISTLIIYIIFKTMRGPSIIKMMLILIAIYLSWQTLALGFRSQFLTLLFLFIEIWILINGTFKQKLLLPILFLVWANTHAGFFIGPVVLGLYGLDIFYKWIIKEKNLTEVIFAAALILISAAATLLNPFTYRIYLEVYNHMQIPMNTIIAEWVAPNGYQILIICLLSFAYIFIHFTSRNFKKYNLFLILLVILFSYLAISARRNLPLFYLSFMIAISFEITKFKFPKKFSKSILDISLFSIYALVLILGVPNIFKTFDFSKNQNNLCEKGYKDFLCAQLDFFKDKSGNIYNTYEWGGYLIWKLPNMKVFVDGRMPAWIGENGESPYTTWLNITQTQPGWNDTLDKYHTDYLLIANGTFLDLLLKDDPLKYNYVEKFRDQQGVIYEHKKD